MQSPATTRPALPERTSSRISGSHRHAAWHAPQCTHKSWSIFTLTEPTQPSVSYMPPRGHNARHHTRCAQNSSANTIAASVKTPQTSRTARPCSQRLWDSPIRTRARCILRKEQAPPPRFRPSPCAEPRARAPQCPIYREANRQTRTAGSPDTPSRKKRAREPCRKPPKQEAPKQDRQKQRFSPPPQPAAQRRGRANRVRTNATTRDFPTKQTHSASQAALREKKSPAPKHSSPPRKAARRKESLRQFGPRGAQSSNAPYASLPRQTYFPKLSSSKLA